MGCGVDSPDAVVYGAQSYAVVGGVCPGCGMVRIPAVVGDLQDVFLFVVGAEADVYAVGISVFHNVHGEFLHDAV